MRFATQRVNEDRENGFVPGRDFERDAEVERLKAELRESRLREHAAREEVRETHRRFEQLRSTSKNFATSMRESSAERRRSRQRIAAQYAVGRVLAEAGELEEAAPNVLRILVEGLGWTLGTFWHLEENVLRCHDLWPRSEGERAFESACRGLSLRRGEGLPGWAWAAGRPVWVEDVLADGGFLRRPAAEESGLRSAIAIPVCDGGRTSGVFELFREEVAPPDEELLRVASAIGGQIGQFAERRRAERERKRLLFRERAARAEAEEARGRTTNILESMGDAFMSFDGDWRFTYINETAAGAIRGMGKDPDALLGKVVWEDLPEVLGTKFETEMRRAAREGEVVEYEEYLPALDAWLGARVYPSEGGVSTYMRDVTERRRASEALRRSEERWRALIEQGADVITISDRDGAIRFASPSIEAVCGYPVDEFVGSNPFEAGHVHPDDVERCAEAFRELSDRPGYSVTLQHRYRHKAGGWRWLEGTFTSFFDDPAIGGLVANFRDVTERKEAERERDRLLAREWVASAEAAERERISRELHDRVAHSMAVAHQSLQLYEVLAGKDAGRAASKLELAREMTKASLESTRNLSAELRHLEAEDHLETELRHLLEAAVPPGVRTALSVKGDETLVPGYVRGQVFLVLREAVRNAVTHSGCASISVGLEVGPEKAVGRVEDDGSGFEKSGGREGVGLRSMRERTALLDGTLVLNGGPGRGARVEVSVPLSGER